VEGKPPSIDNIKLWPHRDYLTVKPVSFLLAWYYFFVLTIEKHESQPINNTGGRRGWNIFRHPAAGWELTVIAEYVMNNRWWIECFGSSQTSGGESSTNSALWKRHRYCSQTVAWLRLRHNPPINISKRIKLPNKNGRWNAHLKKVNLHRYLSTWKVLPWDALFWCSGGPSSKWPRNESWLSVLTVIISKEKFDEHRR